MPKVGIGGLVCSIVGLVMVALYTISMLLHPLPAFYGPWISLLQSAFWCAGLGLGIVGLVSGIVGARKDRKRGAGIASSVLGAIDLAISIIFLVVALLVVGVYRLL